MLSKICNVLAGILGLGGLFFLMSAVGTDDYLVMQGLEGLPWGVLLGRCAIGIGCVLGSVLVWRIGDAYK